MWQKIGHGGRVVIMLLGEKLLPLSTLSVDEVGPTRSILGTS
jgi:hypothetical protein